MKKQLVEDLRTRMKIVQDSERSRKEAVEDLEKRVCQDSAPFGLALGVADSSCRFIRLRLWEWVRVREDDFEKHRQVAPLGVWAVQ